MEPAQKKTAANRIFLGLAALALALALLSFLPFAPPEKEPAVTVQCTFPQVPEQLPVFTAPNRAGEDSLALGQQLGESLGIHYASISAKPDSAMFLGMDERGNSHLLVIESKTLTYTYSCPKKQNLQWEAADGETLLAALQPFGIRLPEKAEIRPEGDGWHSITLNAQVSGERLLDGTLRCRLASDGYIKELEQGILEYPAEDFRAVLTPEEALSQAVKAYYEQIPEPAPVQVEDCILEYVRQENGFVPFYRFIIFREDMTSGWEILIPALKEA